MKIVEEVKAVKNLDEVSKKVKVAKKVAKKIRVKKELNKRKTIKKRTSRRTKKIKRSNKKKPKRRVVKRSKRKKYQRKTKKLSSKEKSIYQSIMDRRQVHVPAVDLTEKKEPKVSIIMVLVASLILGLLIFAALSVVHCYLRKEPSQIVNAPVEPGDVTLSESRRVDNATPIAIVPFNDESPDKEYVFKVKSDEVH